MRTWATLLRVLNVSIISSKISYFSALYQQNVDQHAIVDIFHQSKYKVKPYIFVVGLFGYVLNDLMDLII